MNSWVKHAILAAITIQCIPCCITQCSGIQNPNKNLFYSLLITNNQSEKEEQYSVTATYNLPKILLSDQSQLSIPIRSLKSETAEIDLEPDGFLKIHRLPNINFWDIKIAIDDYGNINYLNRDF